MEDNREFIYRIDAQNRILFANENWYAFARENGVAALKSEIVIGQSLWGFVCNAETKHLFEVLLKKVRHSGVPLLLPYRCDSPECRRFMELRMRLLSDDEVEFRSLILRQEFWPPVRLMKAHVDRTDALLVMCGWCKKVAVPPGPRWVEVEEAVKELNLFHAQRLPGISHGICEPCVAGLDLILEKNS